MRTRWANMEYGWFIRPHCFKNNKGSLTWYVSVYFNGRNVTNRLGGSFFYSGEHGFRSAIARARHLMQGQPMVIRPRDK